MPQKLLLIDGDEMVFKATSAIEQEVDWGDGNHVLWANAETAWDNFLGVIRRLQERFEVSDASSLLCFSGTYGDTPNYRLAISETYKGHRKDRKPMCYWLVRERAERDFKCKSFPGLEADDVMGILATKPSAKHRIICSQDKDMKTLPCTIWDGKDLMTYSEAEADRFHMYQTLIGDTADGYPGCPGVGEVTAEAFLSAPYVITPYEYTLKSGKRKGETETRWKETPCDDVWPGVVAFYEKAGLTEADAIKQAQLARILRHSDWDGAQKRPILWTPRASAIGDNEWQNT